KQERVVRSHRPSARQVELRPRGERDASFLNRRGSLSQSSRHRASTVRDAELRYCLHRPRYLCEWTSALYQAPRDVDGGLVGGAPPLQTVFAEGIADAAKEGRCRPLGNARQALP